MSKTIAIVGGGISGTLVVLNVLKHSQVPVSILWFDDKNSFCKGLAYSTQNDGHLLNVGASNMSVFVDESEHFVNWLFKNKFSYSATDFVPRCIYGNYVLSVFNELNNSNSKVTIEQFAEEVKSIRKENEEFMISATQNHRVQHVVLGFGNFLPAHPLSTATGAISKEFIRSDAYYQKAFSEKLVQNVSRYQNITIIGSGLTMVDVVMSLHKLQYQGKIQVISPHGYLPQAHAEEPLPSIPSFIIESKHYTLLQIVHLVNTQLKTAKANQLHSYAVIDALRPHVQRLWMGFSLDDKKQFLRHLRHKWGVARHRAPSQSIQVLNAYIKSQRLVVLKGRIFDIQNNPDGFEIYYSTKQNQINSFKTQLMVNCTGPESNFEKMDSPLIKQLLADGMIVVDSLKYGLKAMPNGQISDHVYTIGSPLKGILWESTAVPEIRVQAKQLAEMLCS